MQEFDIILRKSCFLAFPRGETLFWRSSYRRFYSLELWFSTWCTGPGLDSEGLCIRCTTSSPRTSLVLKYKPVSKQKARWASWGQPAEGSYLETALKTHSSLFGITGVWPEVWEYLVWSFWRIPVWEKDKVDLYLHTLDVHWVPNLCIRFYRYLLMLFGMFCSWKPGFLG